MACLEMYNNTQSPSSSSSSSPPPMSPRISFSNDFVESHNSQHNNFISSRSELPPASTDFEFSGVSSFNMVSSADELFFKGRLLPFKDTNTQMQRTLRDELLVNDDEPHFSLKPPRSTSSSSSSSSNKWKGFLGLKKSNIASKKLDKIEPCFHSGKRFSFSLEDPNLPKSPQELMSSEGSSSNDMEMGI